MQAVKYRPSATAHVLREMSDFGDFITVDRWPKTLWYRTRAVARRKCRASEDWVPCLRSHGKVGMIVLLARSVYLYAGGYVVIGERLTAQYFKVARSCGIMYHAAAYISDNVGSLHNIIFKQIDARATRLHTYHATSFDLPAKRRSGPNFDWCQDFDKGSDREACQRRCAVIRRRANNVLFSTGAFLNEDNVCQL